MNRYKIDNNLYVVPRYDVMPSSTKGYLKRFVGCFDVCTGQINTFNFLVNEKLYTAMASTGYWQKFCKSLCNDRERVLYDANMPKGELNLPVLTLELVIVGGLENA